MSELIPVHATESEGDFVIRLIISKEEVVSKLLAIAVLGYFVYHSVAML